VEAIEHGWDRFENGDLIEAGEAAGFDLLLTTSAKPHRAANCVRSVRAGENQRHFSRFWSAPTAPARESIGGDAVRTLHSDSKFPWFFNASAAIIALCANCLCSCGRRRWLSPAWWSVHRDVDRDNPNRGCYCLVVAAAASMPVAASASSLSLSLTAREGGLWPDQIRQGRNSPRNFAGSIFGGRLALVCVRRRSSTASG
jgi:hypothetical protein